LIHAYEKYMSNNANKITSLSLDNTLFLQTMIFYLKLCILCHFMLFGKIKLNQLNFFPYTLIPCLKKVWVSKIVGEKIFIFRKTLIFSKLLCLLLLKMFVYNVYLTSHLFLKVLISKIIGEKIVSYKTLIFSSYFYFYKLGGSLCVK